MGGPSWNNGKSSQNTSTTYKTTTTTNPYVTSKTNNKGTVTSFQPNTAFSSIYNFSNANIDKLLNDYLNPTVDTSTNQALLDQYRKTLNDETQKSLQNNIIAPLSKRNMLRSSQVTDLYNSLANKNNDAISQYTANLLSDSQDKTAGIINNLMNYVLQGYNVVNGNQALSLNTSSGNANRTSSGNQKQSGITF